MNTSFFEIVRGAHIESRYIIYVFFEIDLVSLSVWTFVFYFWKRKIFQFFLTEIVILVTVIPSSNRGQFEDLVKKCGYWVLHSRYQNNGEVTKTWAQNVQKKEKRFDPKKNCIFIFLAREFRKWRVCFRVSKRQFNRLIKQNKIAFFIAWTLKWN